MEYTVVVIYIVGLVIWLVDWSVIAYLSKTNKPTITENLYAVCLCVIWPISIPLFVVLYFTTFKKEMN